MHYLRTIRLALILLFASTIPGTHISSNGAAFSTFSYEGRQYTIESGEDEGEPDIRMRILQLSKTAVLAQPLVLTVDIMTSGAKRNWEFDYFPEAITMNLEVTNPDGERIVSEKSLPLRHGVNWAPLRNEYQTLLEVDLGQEFRFELGGYPHPQVMDLPGDYTIKFSGNIRYHEEGSLKIYSKNIQSGPIRVYMQPVPAEIVREWLEFVEEKRWTSRPAFIQRMTELRLGRVPISPKAANVLDEIFGDLENGERQAALRWLQFSPPDVVIDLIAKWLDEKTKDQWRADAIAIVGRFETEKSLTLLKREIREAEGNSKYAAAVALSKVGDAEAFGLLQAMASAPELPKSRVPQMNTVLERLRARLAEKSTLGPD